MRFLITSALPYANGPLHFGHLDGVYVPADIYTRHRRLQGHRVIHICGSDEHGVAIMLNAEKEGTPYPAYVDRWHREHADLFKSFDVEFDFFGQTSAPYHAEEVVRWFKTLYDKKLIGKKSEKQLYCCNDERFLPDRYVEGTCYQCGYANARGDECPNCGEWIEAIRLKKPVCKVCGGSRIEIREVTHYYLLLSQMEKTFREWFATKEGHWRKLVIGFVKGLLDQGMVDRAISRDLDWGIDVPLDEPEATGKKLYVWFDAPIGYVSNTRRFLEENGSKEHYLKDWWDNPESKITHFIGKDNIIFHALIWPCMAMGTGFIRPPTDIPANEFLNLEGKQFSKSAGWYVDAKKAVEEFGSDALRIYLCQLIPETGDTSFTWKNFELSVSDFGNKIGNFIHRALSFMAKQWPEGLSAEAFAALEGSRALKEAHEGIVRVTGELDQTRFTRALAELLELGQRANEFFHESEPWKVVKTDRAAAEKTLAEAVIYIYSMAVLLRPFVPAMASKLLLHFEGVADADLIRRAYAGEREALLKPFSGKGYRNPAVPQVLLPRIDPKRIEACEAELKGKVTV